MLNLLLFLLITQCMTDKVPSVAGRKLFLPLCVEVINTRFLVLLVSLPSRDGES